MAISHKVSTSCSLFKCPQTQAASKEGHEAAQHACTLLTALKEALKQAAVSCA
jgi:hypothetical protein